MFPLTLSHTRYLLSRLALTISTPSPSKVATPGDLTMSERWRLFQNDRRKDQNGWFEVCWRFLPLVFKFTRERMLVNVAVDMVLRCHISTNSEIAALRLHSSWWCRGTYSGDASEILSSANFCRARDSSGQLWAPRAAKVQSWQSRVAEMQGTRHNSMTRCAISWDESLKKCISSFSPRNLPTQLWDLLRPPWVAAAHCSLEKVPGRTSSKSVLRRAAALWSQETRRPHGILVESEQAWIDRNVFSVWLSRKGWMGWFENLTAQHEMSSALCFARQPLFHRTDGSLLILKRGKALALWTPMSQVQGLSLSTTTSEVHPKI